MASELLTEAKVRNAKPAKVDERTIPKLYADGRKLFLRVAPVKGGCSKIWLFRYRRPGNENVTDLGLGPYPDVTLAEAREKATEQRRLLLKSLDPIIERQTARRAPLALAIPTFREVAEQWLHDKQSSKSTRHQADMRSKLKLYADPIIGDMLISAVDTKAILRVLKPKWEEKPVTLERLRGALERIIGLAVTSGYRDDGPNPAAWKAHLENVLKPVSDLHKVQGHAALDWRTMPEFMVALRSHTDRLELRALEFVILTAARASEATGATWPEIDLEARTWTIPADRMKMDRAHVVPLSDAAVRLLEALPRNGDLVFGLVRSSLTRLLNPQTGDKLRPGIIGLKDPKSGEVITAHGFRATFSTWAHEHNWRPEIVEVALAHKNRDKIAAAYNRSELRAQRLRLAEQWAAWCDGMKASADVVTLRTA